MWQTNYASAVPKNLGSGVDFRPCSEGNLLHFVAFFHVASLFSTGVDNKKVGVDNEKALELTNSTVFHRGRQQKSSRTGQQNIFFHIFA